MTDKKNITRFSPKNLFLGEQKGVPHRGRMPWSVRNFRDTSLDNKHLIDN